MAPFSGPIAGSAQMPAEWGVDRDLLQACRPHFQGAALREVLQAHAGLKVSRLAPSDEKAAILHRLAEAFGFAVIDGRRRYICGRDTGKGGFGNHLVTGSVGRTAGIKFAYVARTAEEAEAARHCEEAGDSEGFGLRLGIPSCCRKAYRTFLPEADRSHQGDLLPQVWSNSSRHKPFDPWLNIAARYFGTCLISFFPCSFHCSAAHRVATEAFKLLSTYDPTLAHSFLAAHRTNILYTDRLGVHLFTRGATSGRIAYDQASLLSTEESSLSSLLRRGDNIVVENERRIIVRRGELTVGQVSGGGLYACLFATERHSAA